MSPASPSAASPGLALPSAASVASPTPPPAAPGPADASLHLVDDPREWSAFSRPVKDQPGQWESNVVFDGMHCAACAITIEDALKKVPGVQSAAVSAASHRARVVWNQQQVLPSRWMVAAEGAGYRAVPANDTFAAERRRDETRKMIWRWAVAGLCMMQVMMYAWPIYVADEGTMTRDILLLLRWASWILSVPVLIFSCRPFFANALRDLRHRSISMDLPVALGMVITFVVSTIGTFEPDGVFGREVYFDSFTMFVFFLLTGRWMELRLRDRTAGALEALMNRLPDGIDRQKPDGSGGLVWERVAVRRLEPGDVIRVRPGEAFPADGTVLQGETLADEALLTGESTPVPRGASQAGVAGADGRSGAQVIAGSHNLLALVQVQVERVGEHTRFAQIVALMEDASVSRPRIAQLADRLAKPFLVFVLLAAAAAAIGWWPKDPGHAVMIAVAVLVVTCPCALSLATPAAMLASAGALAKGGVLVRRLEGLEALAGVDTLVFDKTGTLTQDAFVLQRITTRDGVAPADALAQAAALAQHSLHPVSRALMAAQQAAAGAQKHEEKTGLRHDVKGDVAIELIANASPQPGLPPEAASPAETASGDRAPAYASAYAPGYAASEVVEQAGQGVSGSVWPAATAADGAARPAARRVKLGSAAFCQVAPPQTDGLHVVLADEQGWLATFELHEHLRADAVATVAALQKAGVAVRLLSGDSPQAVARVAAQTGIAHAQGGCSPQDKLAFLRQAQAEGHKVAMVGDGLNDGPVLAGAHVSFAFGQAVPLAQAQSDFVVLGGGLSSVAQTLQQARRTLRIVRQNLAWAAGYNLLFVPLAFMGRLPAWLAGIGMAASSLLVVANAVRLAGGLTPKNTANAGGAGTMGAPLPTQPGFGVEKAA